MKEIIVPRNNSVYQTLLMLCPIALFFAVRSFYNNYYTSSPTWWILLLLGALIILCTYFFLNSLQKVRTGQAALRLNKAGLEDNISMAKPGLVDWSNIKGSAIVKYTGSDHLLIYLKDPSPVLAPLNFFQNKMALQMIEDVGTPIAINPKLIRYDVKKLAELINRKAKRR